MAQHCGPGLRRCLQSHHPTWVPFNILAVSLPFQLPANSLRKGKDGQSVWDSSAHMGDPDEVSGFSLSQSG